MKQTFIFFLVLAVVGLAGWQWWGKSLGPVSADNSPVRFVIAKGTSAAAVGNQLAGVGIIKNALAFKIYLQLSGRAKNIQAGEYTLYRNKALPLIVAELLKGPRELWVTIPEGLRKEEVAVRLADGLGKTGSEYTTFVDEFLTLSAKSEGYLFPDTYLFPREVKAALVYTKMIDTFSQKVNFEVSQKEIILASIIERETKGNEEKPVVAGILLKRLAAGWALQVDATVQYAVGTKGKYWEPLTKANLAVKSAYNTYRNKGLPPTAICSPGLASIKAALSPTDSAYWFYLHDSQGKIHYAENAEEQAVNVRQYLK